MERQIFFFDMDGTLIPPALRKVLPSTVEAVHDLQRQGHLCFLCTGRSYQMAMEYSDVVHPDGVIFCNGAGVMMHDQPVWSHPFAESDVHELVRLCQKFHGGIQLLNEKHSFQNLLMGVVIQLVFPKHGRHLSTEQKKRRASMVPMRCLGNEPVLKADVSFIRKSDADRFYAEMPENLACFRTRGRYLHQAEIMAGGISKAKGIAQVLAMLDMDRKDAWCFGDSINDIEMMKYCGHSIAMGNAGKQVKEIADDVCDDANHDGIAKALKKYGWRKV
ncbi:MAG: HAD family hydrolase [Bulleidia sp.]